MYIAQAADSLKNLLPISFYHLGYGWLWVCLLWALLVSKYHGTYYFYFQMLPVSLQVGFVDGHIPSF